MGVSEALALRHGPGFVAPALTLQGKKHQHIGQTPKGMKAPKRIPRTELWLETNQSALSALRLIERLLKALGRQPAEFAVTYE